MEFLQTKLQKQDSFSSTFVAAVNIIDRYTDKHYETFCGTSDDDLARRARPPLTSDLVDCLTVELGVGVVQGGVPHVQSAHGGHCIPALRVDGGAAQQGLVP